jgi:GMP synthase (glutamine-hydrolysing)
VIGGSVTRERLGIVRWADAHVTKILEKYGLYKDISQLIVALIAVDTVGVKGDSRAYGPAIVVRAVETVDFMTVIGVQIPSVVRREISTVLSKHKGIVRVWYDEMSKPPATTEFE